MRLERNYIYYDFIHYFVSAVIGKMDYKKRLCSFLLSSYATVSDEAFAILSLENNYDTWMDMGLTGNTKTSNVPRKYTNGGKSKGTAATSQHNKGWSNEGLCRFNDLFDLVEKNRATHFAKHANGVRQRHQENGKKLKSCTSNPFKFVMNYGVTMKMKLTQILILTLLLDTNG